MRPRCIRTYQHLQIFQPGLRIPPLASTAHSILADIRRYLYKLYQSNIRRMLRAGGEYSRQKIHVLVLLTLA